MKELRRSIFTVGIICFLLIPLVAQSDSDAITDSKQLDPNIKNIIIDSLSARPLYLIQVNGSQVLGKATGFVVRKGSSYYLITNWHVVSGRHPETNQVQHQLELTPDAILIWHHGKQLGSWVKKKEYLFDEKGKRRWFEHKKGRFVDVIALPLRNTGNDVTLYPFDLLLAETDMLPEVAMPVSIIGFPLGFTSSGFFPIWKTGHIASEPNLDYQGEPLFLIDATTRGGMSGSPVVLRMTGGYKKKDGSAIMSSSGHRTLFLGIYSGRLPRDSEIGRVWRPRLVNEILE